MTFTGFTLTRIVDELNKIGVVTTIQNLSNKLSRDTLKFYEVEQILNIMGQTLNSMPIQLFEISNYLIGSLTQEEYTALMNLLNNPTIPYEQKLLLRNMIIHTGENPRQVALSFLTRYSNIIR